MAETRSELIHVRIYPDVYRWIKEKAAKEDRTYGSIVSRELIKNMQKEAIAR